MTKYVKDRRGRTLLNRLDSFVDTAREASSRGAAFLYSLCGILAQVAHNALLAYDVSLFENEYLKIAQAIVVAMAVSFALMYFVLTSDGKQYSSSGNTIQTFFTLEVFLNTVYYLKKIVFDGMYVQVQDSGTWSNLNWAEPNWFMLLIGLPFAFFIPFIIKSYAGSIDAHKPALALDEEDFVKDSKMQDGLGTVHKRLDSLSTELRKHTSIDNSDNNEQFDKLRVKYDKLFVELKANANEPIDKSSIVKHLKTVIEQDVNERIAKLQEHLQSYHKTAESTRSHVADMQDAQDITKTTELVNTLTEEIESLKGSLGKRFGELNKRVGDVADNSIKAGSVVSLATGDKKSIFKIGTEPQQ